MGVNPELPLPGDVQGRHPVPVRADQPGVREFRAGPGGGLQIQLLVPDPLLFTGRLPGVPAR
jgi:hypothetical protein